MTIPAAVASGVSGTGQRIHRGNGVTGTPVRVSGSSLAFGSHGACRRALTCCPSTRCTASSRRGSSTGSWCSGFHASRPRTITLIDGKSTVAPTPVVVIR